MAKKQGQQHNGLQNSGLQNNETIQWPKNRDNSTMVYKIEE